MRFTVGCNLDFQLEGASTILLNIEPAKLQRQQVLREDLRLTPEVSVERYTMPETGNRILRLIAAEGGLRIAFEADVDLNVRATSDLSVSVPDAAGFLPAGADVGVSARWNDLTTVSGADGPQLDLSRLSRIFALDIKPGSQAELFAIVLKTLQTLAAQLAVAAFRVAPTAEARSALLNSTAAPLPTPDVAAR